MSHLCIIRLIWVIRLTQVRYQTDMSHLSDWHESLIHQTDTNHSSIIRLTWVTFIIRLTWVTYPSSNWHESLIHYQTDMSQLSIIRLTWVTYQSDMSHLSIRLTWITYPSSDWHESLIHHQTEMSPLSNISLGSSILFYILTGFLMARKTWGIYF